MKINQYMMKKWYGIVLVLASVLTVQAALVVEQFDYTEGSLEGKNGGSGFGAAWSSATGYTVTSPGLDYDGITNGAAGLKVTSDAAAGGAARRTLGQAWGVDGTTFYLSVILQKTVASDNTRYWGLQLYNAANAQKMTIGQNSGSPVFQVNANTGGSISSTVNSQSESLLLIRVDSAAGSNDVVTFWINPDLSKTEEQNVAVGTKTIDLGQITQLRMGGGATSGPQVASTHIIDEIRLSSDSLFAAIPEPATMGLFAFTGVSLLAVRRWARR